VWRRIEQCIEPGGATPPLSRLWNSLNFWRGLGISAAMLVLVIGLSLVGLQRETGELERLLVVLNDQSQAGWLVAAPERGGTLRVSAVQPTSLPADKVCQLWMITQDRSMVPVGVLPHRGSMEMAVPVALQRDSRFRVSIEAAALAPVKRPSKQIVFEGRLTRI
jgi:anti-sigma-K factor RskA